MNAFKKPKIPRRTNQIASVIHTSFISLFFFVLTNTTYADMNDFFEMDLEDLLEITVTSATKTEKPLSSTPGSVTLITRQQIESSGAQTLPSLLRNVPGVNVRWNPMAETIDIRGFGENPLTNRVLLLIDGIPFNSQTEGGFAQHIGFDFFNLDNVKQVEVIRGGGSALYGENAYWGVINIATLSGKDIQGGRIRYVNGDLNTDAVSIQAGNEYDHGDWLVSAQLLESQLPLTFWYEESDAVYEGQDLFIKGSYKQARFSYYRHQAENDGFRLSFNDLLQNSYFQSADLIEETIDVFAGGYTHEVSESTTLNVDLSYTQRKGTQCSACHAAQQYPDSSSVGNHGSQFIGDVRLEYTGIENHHILLGIEGRHIDAGSDRTELISTDPSVEHVLDYKKYALYFQDEISVLDNKLNIITGLRYDYATNPTLFDSYVSPRLAFVYNHTQALTFKGGVSRSFHFPDFTTMYLDSWFLNESNNQQAIPSVDFVPNPELQPEEIRNIDLSVEWLIDSKTSLSANLFKSTVDDFIVMVFYNYPRPQVDEHVFENHTGRATIRGGEIELKHKPSNQLLWYLNLAYQYNETDDDRLDSGGNPIEFSYSPERKINFGVSYNDFYNLFGSIELNWKDDYIAPTIWYFGQPVEPLPDYTLLNAQIGYDFSHLLSNEDTLKLSFIGRNLLDKTPIETLLGVRTETAGRLYFGRLDYKRSF